MPVPIREPAALQRGPLPSFTRSAGEHLVEVLAPTVATLANHVGAVVHLAVLFRFMVLSRAAMASSRPPEESASAVTPPARPWSRTADMLLRSVIGGPRESKSRTDLSDDPMAIRLPSPAQVVRAANVGQLCWHAIRELRA
ncbi:hypothetical protein Ahu01nite_094240 [Winogradskya humida]|uniref:Uncharacterized protein n=1 Tax=Winogradskya humida TaxID=113566 RepID=A0ABQ4A633_9ACTN|nr:hypothetical protein Ahu01nite_094240 [Actinoplanes humidus]